MYEAFYGLKERPFSLQPDPGFLYLGKKHSLALTMLEYGLLNRATISLITGDIGSGKTTLIRKVLAELDQDVSVGLISNTHDTFGNLFQWVAVAFGLKSKSNRKAQLNEEFSQFLIKNYAAGRRAVLIVDEAQNLDRDTLEEVRLLSNINTDKDQLLQIVLVGQPELRKTLRKPTLEQFVQRIGVDFHIGPLDAAETDSYIGHRLAIAGGDPETFTPAAKRFIHYQSGGVPRIINQLCDTSLVYAFAESSRYIQPKMVFEIVLERLQAGLFGAGKQQAGESHEEAIAYAQQRYEKAIEETK